MATKTRPGSKRGTSRSSVARRSAAVDKTRYGCQTPRIWTPPLRELTPETSLGFECVEFADWIHERVAQIAEERGEPELLELAPKLHEWQRWFLIHALELLPGPDQLFRFRTVLLLVARQNGKTALMVYLILWRLFQDGARLVVGSAQNVDVAEEAWEIIVQIAEAIPELDDEIKRVTWGSGKRALKLEANETYKVVPSTRGGGRGKSGDLVLLDELREHTSWSAWAAISKTTMARPRAQVYGVSNAGDAASLVLRALRFTAHLALGDPDGLNAAEALLTLPLPADDDEQEFDPIDDESALAIFEWSAPPGANRRDRNGWAQANPSLGFGQLTERAIAAALGEPEWIFRTEVLCQWSEGSLEGPFPEGVWTDEAPTGCLDPESHRPKKSRIAVGIDTSWDRSTTYVAVAAFRKDGLIHVELIARRAGTDWAIPFVQKLAETRKVFAVTFQANGAPVSSLKDEAERSGLPFVEWAGSDLGRWTGLFYDKVRAIQIRHLPQPPLDIAAAVAVTRPAGDSWMWDRKNSPADIAPLVAVTAAVGALLNEEPEVESAYADDDYELSIV